MDGRYVGDFEGEIVLGECEGFWVWGDLDGLKEGFEVFGD